MLQYRFNPPPRPLLPVAVLVLALSACTTSSTAEPEKLPLGEVRGGSGLTEHTPETLLRALLLPLGDDFACTADDSVNPRWARCDRYELADCSGGAFGFACDVAADGVPFGSLQSRVSGNTWSFSAHWGEQLVQGVRDFDGAVVRVSK
jgi:hypothetical protein